ncbi:MAG: hypothetical protein U0163_08950 [Gemmatimonadaceae bacterium]
MNDFLALVLWASAPLMPVSGGGIADTSAVVRSADTVSVVAPGAPQQLPTLQLKLPDVSNGDADQQKRTKAIEYSDWYNRRLTIHKVGAYLSLPLFATEYWLGNKLMNDLVVKSWVRPMHGTVASAIGVVFAANSLTGLWNLYDSRNDPHDRARKIVHTVGMLAADAGFLVTASLAGESEGVGGSNYGSRAQNHKNAALVSIGLASASTIMMWVWKH